MGRVEDRIIASNRRKIVETEYANSIRLRFLSARAPMGVTDWNDVTHGWAAGVTTANRRGSGLVGGVDHWWRIQRASVLQL
ncbi:hypothetical protein Pmani_033558 [Petrolisthes manimaculis]|uniref:Uncharacterized protein n=1 Tax=Petrolisthes manimaculis TaxID=1843537 RepID=A0AAE1NR13_9EUCA|nr:hypothetical protein Pmani_033558 [Petrolisthes manimaculis]